MTAPTPERPPNGHESPANWISVSQASAALNVSEKTVRKRIKTGEMEAKRVPQKRGGISYLVSLETETEVEVEPEPERNRKGSNNGFIKPETPTEPERKRGGSETELEMVREQLQRERELNAFFRLQIEEGNRNAAELRAALRKALEAMPKAITSGAAETAPEATTATAISPDEPTPASVGKAPQIPVSVGKAPQIPVKREARPLWKVILGVR
jgi:hypothetical protein